jgi:hypothetical protein
VEIYDLAADPGETRDLAHSSPEIERTLERELDRFDEELVRRGPLDFSLEQVAIPDELRGQLGVLGYLDGESGGLGARHEAGDASAD